MVIILTNYIGSGQVGILDGTNTRTARREMIKKRLSELKVPYKTIFIESICTLESIVTENIETTMKTSPDYTDWSKNNALDDLYEKIKIFEMGYENLSKEKDGLNAIFIKFINQGTEIITRNLRGYYESKLLSFLVNIHTGNRPIYFSRHGESMHNTKGLIGGDSLLSPFGEKYGLALKNYFENESKTFSQYTSKCKVYCSTLRRTIQTAKNLKFIDNYVNFKNLDEINVGVCDSITYKEFELTYPEEFKERTKDKLRYRYPRGESYLDMIHRIENVIYELERQAGPVIVIGHQGNLRALYGYFASVPVQEIPVLEIPLHTVIKFTPNAYGFTEERIVIDPDTQEYKVVNIIGEEKEDTLLHNSKEYNSIYK